MKILIVATQRYSINACDFDMFFRNSDHKIVKVLHHKSVASKGWFRDGKYNGSTRNYLATKLTDHPRESWSGNTELLKKIDKVDFDYLCLGNGNDDTGMVLQKKLGCDFLFSEYGWLPWEKSFYIDGQGVGPQSSIFKANLNNIKIDKNQEISSIKNELDRGINVPYKDYIYIPLQVDTPTSDGKPDFKYRFTKFKNNNDFLNFVSKVMPKDIPILVKNHPSTRRKTEVLDPMINISGINYNKYQLYSNMLAMVAINSTSVLEALMFNKKIFTYGKDIFCNKGIVYEDVYEPWHFERLLDGPALKEQKTFLNLLLQRQVCRHKCKDKEYVKSHYWNKALIGGSFP